MPPKFIVADAKGKILRDLGPDGIVVGEIVGVGDTPGPVTFVGNLLRREVNPPFFVNGDKNGAPEPWSIVAGHTMRVMAVAGPEQTPLDATIAVGEPKPVVVMKTMGPSTTAGDGIRNQDAIDVHVISYEQNLVYNDGLSHTIRNVISEKAYTRDRENQVFKGQGMYVEDMGANKPTNFDCTGGAFLDNGYSNSYLQPTNPPSKPHWKGMYWHGNYVNRHGSMKYKSFIFGNNANCGIKMMRNARFEECLILHNSIGAQLLYDPSQFINCIWYRSSWYWDGSRDIGRLGIDGYADLTLQGNLFIDGPVSTWADPLENPMSLGLMKMNKSHKQYTDTPGGKLISASGNLVYNWPLSSDGLLFSGDAWPKDGQGRFVQNPAGFAIKTGAPITYNEVPVIEAMRRHDISPEEACKTIMADLRKLVPSV